MAASVTPGLLPQATAPATYRALLRLARPLRVRSRAGWLAFGVGLAALLLGGAAWAARLGWFSAPYWVLLAWGAALTAVVAVAYAAWGAQSRLSLRRLALRLEEMGAWRRGTLTSLLDTAAPGTSGLLLAAADRAQAAELERRGGQAVEPIARPVRMQAFGGAAVLLCGALAFASADPVRGPAAALWHPGKAWKATIAPVTLHAAADVVDRGRSVDLYVEAIGHKTATLWLRAPGESWRPRGVRLDSLGRAVIPTGPLETDLFARVTSGRRSSDTLYVRVRLPVFLGALTVTAHYPAYLGLDDEPVPTGGDTLILPVGTRLETKGEATAPLARAVWVRGGDPESSARATAPDSGDTGPSGRAAGTHHEATKPLRVSATRFSGSFVPTASGEYRLVVETANGAMLAGDTVRLPIRLLADSAPQIEIPVPGTDTLAPLSLLVPLVIDARDDHGLAAVAIESRRISRLGLVDSAKREPVALPPGRTDRAMLSFRLDLNRRGLLPGDTVRYTALATDNAPRSQTTRSREFVLRLPTLSEVRAAQRQATTAVAGRLDSVVAQSRQLERQTDDLARERPRASGNGGERGANSLTFEQAKRAEGIAQAQQQLVRQAEELKESLEALRRSAEAAGVADSAWQRELQEIREQLDRAMSPELRERLAALQQSLKELDAEQTKEALERLAEAQKQLREALERSRELFRRAALEGDLANLTQESRDLAREQRRWNDQALGADSARSSAAERQLAGRADSLGTALDRLAKSLASEGRREQLESAADQAQQAAQQMRQAATSAQRGQRPQARRQGEQASKALEPLGDQLQREREGMQQGWREEVVQAMDRALAETSRLAERQLALQQQLRRGRDPKGAARAEQAALEEGVQKVLEQMRQVAGKNALVPQQIGASLAAAQQQMAKAREAVSSAVPNTREAAEQAGGAVDALNAAAYQMLRARGDVSGAASGSGLAEALERMAQLAQQQGGLGEQGAGLLPMAGSGAIREQLRRLGMRQRGLAQELQKLRGGGNIPGAGEMADEAEDLARRLEAGRFNREVVQRQERLFRRMLDAGRTLQGREEDEKKERQSTTAADDSVRLPPALRARLVDDENRLRMPSWEELQQLSPEERRLVIDYFRRLSEAPEKK